MRHNIKFCKHCFENKKCLAPDETIDYYAGYMVCIKADKLKDVTECPLCGQNSLIETNITEEELDIIGEASNYNRQLLEAMIDLKEKDIIEYELKMSQFRNQVTQQKNTESVKKQESNQPKCPKCGSTSIQIVSRKWSLLAGFATKKTDRVCVNCKHRW